MANDGDASVKQFFSHHTPADHREEELSSSTQEIADLTKSFNECALRDFLRLDEMLEWIKHNSFKRVALQLPDYFLSRSYSIAKLIESNTDAKVFVLADTSYRSCCVDEVGAAHAVCDCIVHFGDACLSALTENIPVKFIFGTIPINLKAFESVESYFVNAVGSKLLLLTDACYSDSLPALESIILKSSPSLVFCANVVDPSHRDAYSGDSIVSLGRIISREFIEASSVMMIFVGDPASPVLSLWLMTYPQCNYLVLFDPKSSRFEESKPSSFRQLRKRLFLVEKLRDARTVGLVVGSVGVRGHVEAVQRVRSLCKTAEKRLYVISVGKVNTAKLSNFANIDVFILLSCPFGIILDSSNFYAPVLSMFEAEMALNPTKSWNGCDRWSADFSTFANDEIGQLSEAHADVSLITGRIRAGPEQNAKGSEEAGELLPYEKSDYFESRTWCGLDANVRLDQSTQVEEGRTGTALGYDTEPSRQ